MFSIYEVYNNIPYNADVEPDFGYSCFIKEPGVLFDAGAKGDVLLKNMEVLGISPEQVVHFVLSHDHWDHNGGIKAVLGENPDIMCYCPPDTSSETRSILEMGAGCISVNGWQELSPGVSLTGPVEGIFSGKSIIEQSLVLESKNGLFLVTGCSHPHISKIVAHVRTKGELFGVMGGFHDVDRADINSLEGIEYLAPSHCTTAIEEINAEFPEKFHRCGAGFIHRI
ncbi:MAG: MBL fold metallo-hydrolase [Methanomicrobiaceae archaeon]|nr:MBL fold metallo-hydrolase [Methanomicrobiaceae archaeon]